MSQADAGPEPLSRSRVEEPAEEMVARDPACQGLGIRLEEIAPGRATLHMRVTSDMMNGHGIAHGGYLFILADAAFAQASNTHGQVAVAQSAQITFLRPAAAGVVLLAEAVERTRQGRFGVYDVTVRQTDGTVVAEFRGHSVLLAGAGSLGAAAGAPAGGDQPLPALNATHVEGGPDDAQ